MAASDAFPVDLENWKRIAVQRSYSPEELEMMVAGFQPQDMDDRWYIAVEAGLLVFRRSWTGYPIFAVSICEEDGRMSVASAWGTRNRDHYNPSAIDDEAEFLERLIEGHLLTPRKRH